MNSKSQSRSGGRDFLKESVSKNSNIKASNAMSFESANPNDLENAPKAMYSGHESVETRSGGNDKNIFKEKNSNENQFEFILK